MPTGARPTTAPVPPLAEVSMIVTRAHAGWPDGQALGVPGASLRVPAT